MPCDVLKADFESGYDGFRIRLRLCVDKGQVICIIGPNASGKTTILKTILGLLRLFKGDIRIKGKSIFEMGLIERARTLSAVIPERPPPGMLTVADLVLLGRTPHTSFIYSKRDYEMAYEALVKCGLVEYIDKYFDELSDGYKQRALIARALAQETPLIVLDEPTAHLDPKAKEEVLRLLRDLAKREEKAIIMATHDIEYIHYCDIVIGVKGGRVVFVKEIEDLTEEDLEVLYGLNENRRCDVEAYIVGGLGTGRRAYLTLWRLGIPFATGPLFEWDVDYQISRRLGALIVRDLAEAEKIALKARFILDTGFPINCLTKGLYDLVLRLCESKTVLTLRKRLECKNALYIRGIDELKKTIKEVMK